LIWGDCGGTRRERCLSQNDPSILNNHAKALEPHVFLHLGLTGKSIIAVL
jgi:hypothetical protein